MGLIGRYVGHVMGSRWFMQVIYVDDLHGSFIGNQKFLHLWVLLLAYELVSTPFGYHKFKGGLSSDFVGFRYDLCEVGITEKRGKWLRESILKVAASKYIVQTREFAEFLGRWGFVSQLLTWMKAHLAPLYSWSVATSSGTVAKLPETVILSLRYLLKELSSEFFLVSGHRPLHYKTDQFRADAKCIDDLVVIAGWECKGPGRDGSLWISGLQMHHSSSNLVRVLNGHQSLRSCLYLWQLFTNLVGWLLHRAGRSFLFL